MTTTKGKPVSMDDYLVREAYRGILKEYRDLAGALERVDLEASFEGTKDHPFLQVVHHGEIQVRLHHPGITDGGQWVVAHGYWEDPSFEYYPLGTTNDELALRTKALYDDLS